MLALAIIASSGAAQVNREIGSTSRSDSRLVRAVGKVLDGVGVPVSEADVSTRGSRTRTDSAGQFLLWVPNPRDSVTITVRRVGYEAVSFTVAADTLARNDLAIELNAIPRSLEEMRITEERTARVPAIEAFAERRRQRQGSGIFLDRSELREREHQPLTSILRPYQGITVVPRGGRDVLRFARWRARGTSCAPHVFLDGLQVQGLEVDDIPTPDVQAIELYANSASAPIEFATLGFGCGIVAIWTRRPILKTP